MVHKQLASEHHSTEQKKKLDMFKNDGKKNLVFYLNQYPSGVLTDNTNIVMDMTWGLTKG